MFCSFFVWLQPKKRVFDCFRWPRHQRQTWRCRMALRCVLCRGLPHSGCWLWNSYVRRTEGAKITGKVSWGSVRECKGDVHIGNKVYWMWIYIYIYISSSLIYGCLKLGHFIGNFNIDNGHSAIHGFWGGFSKSSVLSCSHIYLFEPLQEC